jgi:hypothetical protein
LHPAVDFAGEHVEKQLVDVQMLQEFLFLLGNLDLLILNENIGSLFRPVFIRL